MDATAVRPLIRRRRRVPGRPRFIGDDIDNAGAAGGDGDDDDTPLDSSGGGNEDMGKIAGSLFVFFGALLTLLLRLIQLVAVVFSWFFFIVSMLPWIAVGVGITLVMVPYVLYQDVVIEEVDFFMRCRFYPFWQTWPRQLLAVLQMVYDPLICWWDATFWLPLGIIQEVLLPLLVECQVWRPALALLQFILVFLVDFVGGYIATLQFLTGDFNYVPSGVAWNAFWTSWQGLISCFCEDLAVFLKAGWIITLVPPISPIPVQIMIGLPTSVAGSAPPIATVFLGPILGLIAGNQTGDTRFWCFLWSTFNGMMAIVQELFRFFAALFTGQLNASFKRPDFTRAADNLCTAGACLMRSAEAVNQFLFDNFIPIYRIDWDGFLSMYDIGLCLVIQAANNVLLIIVNIDKVLAYPADPFYDTVILPKVQYWINLMGPVRYQSPTLPTSQYPVQYTSWNWPSTSPLIPGTVLANPLYEVNRLSDGLCIYFRRLICDPTDPLTQCYQTGAQTILGPFQTCCGIVEAVGTVADVIAFLFDMSRHMYSFDAITIFLNNQYITTTLAIDLTAVIRCLFNAFAIIPELGPCLAQFLSGIAGYILGVLDILIRILVGLVFLAYYLINNIPNYITNRGQAITQLLELTAQFTNYTLPDSTINCGCFVLNVGIPIPPVPCTSCVPGGYLTPTLTFNLSDVVYPNRGQPCGAGRDWQPGAPPRRTPQVFERKNFGKLPPEVAANTTEFVRQRMQATRERILAKIAEERARFSKPPPPATHAAQEEEGNRIRETFPLSPTQPPVSHTCSNPVPQCFDFCCFLRTLATLLYDVLFFLSQTINSLAQDWDIGFPFFVDGNVSICSAQCPTQQVNAPNCATPCPGINISFEHALSNVVTSLASALVCFCNVVNLVIPIIGFGDVYTERPDICCWVVRLGDLVAATLLVFIRLIKELATGNENPVPGGPPFPYFTEGQFIIEIDQLFDIALDVIICVGYLVRAVLPPGQFGGFDAYCPVEQIAIAAIYLAEWAVNSVISLGTIQYTVGQNYFIDPNCNWEARNCVPQVTQLGFFRDGVRFINGVTGLPGGACSDSFSGTSCSPTHSTDQGLGGLIMCVCNVLNTIIPIRPNPSAGVGPGNCPTIDICCPFRQISFATGTVSIFVLQGLTTVWQRWDGAYPSAFMAFFFCNENASIVPPACGILQPAITQLTDIISLCICQVFQMFDAFLATFFPGFRCFCGGGFPQGIFCSLGDFVNIVLIQVTTLIRRANDLTYWQPEGYPAPDQSLTWAVRFFSPMQQQLCSIIGASVCFFNTLVPFCPNWFSRMMQSPVEWLTEAITRLFELLEGFISTFAGAPCGSVVTTSAYSINPQCLSGALISLFGFFFDALLADGMIACRSDVCACHNGIYVKPGDGSIQNYTFSNAISQNVFGQDGRQPQPCTKSTTVTDAPWWFQTCCNGTAATYVLPNGVTKVCLEYNATLGTPVPECLAVCNNTETKPSPCVTNIPTLPMCDSVVGFLPIDGVIMAIFRYIRCIFQVAFGGGALFDGLIVLVSVLWQLSKPIINVLAGGIMLLLSLFINPGGPFDFLGQVVGFFSSFSALFNGGLITSEPALPFISRYDGDIIRDFREERRLRGEKHNSQRTGFSQHGSVLAGMERVFMNYTINDCNDDLRTCTNRNLGFQCDTLDCTMLALNALFDGNTTCDHVIRDVTFGSRAEFVYCVERRIIGERVRAFLYPSFPVAAFYTGWQFVPALLKEINDGFMKGYDYNAIPMEPEPEQDMDNTLLNRELDLRAQRLRKELSGNDARIERVIRWDAMEYKLRSGYYSKLLKRASNRAHRSVRERVPSTWKQDAATLGRTVVQSSLEIATIISSKTPEAVVTMVNSMLTARDMLTDTTSVFKHWYTFKADWYERVFNAPVLPEDQARREMYWEMFRQGPLYQWLFGKSTTTWKGPSLPIVPFIKHLYNVSRVYKASGEPGFWNAYGLGKHWNATREHLVDRFATAHWTPLQVHNYMGVKRVGLKIFDTLYPGQLSQAQHERFILDDGCPLINDSVNLAVSVYSYCANINSGNVLPNVTLTLKNRMFGDVMGPYLDSLLNKADEAAQRLYADGPKRCKRSAEGVKFMEFLPSTARSAVDGRGGNSNIPPAADAAGGGGSSIHLNQHVLQYPLERWEPLRGNVNGADEIGWKWPRMQWEFPPLPDHLNISRVGYKAYKRATETSSTSDSSFNLYSWLLSVVDDWFGLEIAQKLAQFFIDLKQSASNPNYKCSQWPDVGMKFYVLFNFLCEFPCNVDCHIGMGLERALGWVLLCWGIAILICLFVSQSTLSTLLGTTVLTIVFLIVTPNLAWGFSVRCALIMPPLGLPVLPFCGVDDILAILDKYISACYSFLWASYMLNSPNACPACPARFDFINCASQVGLGDGLSNYLYAGWYVGGSTFCSLVQGTVGSLLPFTAGYLQGKCDLFSNSNAIVQSQLVWCWWSTLPSMLFPLALGALGATFVGFVLPALFNVIIAAGWAILASPLGAAASFNSNFSPTGDDGGGGGGGQRQGQGGNTPVQRKHPSAFFAGQSLVAAAIGHGIRRVVHGKVKRE